MNKNIEIYVTGESDIKYIKENENGSVKWILKKI